jgi:hypothetical protein
MFQERHDVFVRFSCILSFGNSMFAIWSVMYIGFGILAYQIITGVGIHQKFNGETTLFKSDS